MAAPALATVTTLPAHVLIETYSVLTRLPSGLAVSASVAADVLASRFGSAPLRLDAAARIAALERLASAGVFGGATYDGLVALEAQAHGRTLLTLDRRAQTTYTRLGVTIEVLQD